MYSLFSLPPALFFLLSEGPTLFGAIPPFEDRTIASFDLLVLVVIVYICLIYYIFSIFSFLFFLLSEGPTMFGAIPPLEDRTIASFDMSCCCSFVFVVEEFAELENIGRAQHALWIN